MRRMALLTFCRSCLAGLAACLACRKLLDRQIISKDDAINGPLQMMYL